MDATRLSQLPSNLDFFRSKVGRNWVLHRRTARIVHRYGADVVCLSHKQYDAIEAEYALLVETATIEDIMERAELDDPVVLAALREAYRAGKAA